MVSSDHGHGELLLERRRSGLPMVFLDGPAPVPEIDSLTTDNRVGACAAVTHLAACGHRRIAFLGDLHSIWTAAERERGYLEGLAAARIPVDRGLIRRDIRSGDEALQAVVELLAMAADRAVHRPELISIGAVRGLRRLGAQRRIALVGFDDVQLADCSIRPSRSWLRIRRRSAGPRPGCSSPGWTAGRVRPSTSWSSPGW